MRVEDHVKFLLADLLNLNPLELLNHLGDYVEEKKVELFKMEIDSLRNGKPLQYVLGNVNFYGNKFMVDQNVLIPRYRLWQWCNRSNFKKRISKCRSGFIRY